MNKIYADVTEDENVDEPNFQWVVLASEAEEREAALREELKSLSAVRNQNRVLVETVKEVEFITASLKQSLTVAEQRSGKLEAALINVRETLGREYWDQFAGLDETRDILDAVLKPAAEVEELK